MRSIQSESDLEAFMAGHADKRILVFKHSTTCPISARAYREVERFEAAHGDVPIALIRVIEERPISQGFAARVGIPHASPQAIAFENGSAVWNASHHAITADALSAALIG